MTMTFLCTVPLQRVSRDSVTIISAFIIIIIIIIIDIGQKIKFLAKP